VLLVIAIVATPLVVIGAWAKVQINDTDRYVDTVAPLADDPQVQQYVATELVDAFNANVDVGSFVTDQLPSQLQGLAPTITSAVQGLVSAAANRFTASPAFKAIWVDANRAAHRVISGVLTGDRDALELTDGQLSLDLGDALRALQTRLVDSGFEVAGRVDLSGVDHQIVLADGPRLAKLEDAREMVGRLNRLVWVLGVVALLAAIGSVLLAPRRKAALIRLAIGLAAVVVVIGVGVAAARRAFVSSIGQTVPSSVAGSFFDAIVNSIRFGFRLVFVLALIVAALVAVASLPSYPTRWARPAQIGVAVLAAVALIAAPEPTTGLVLLIVILLVVAEVALEVARRRGLATEPPSPPSPGLASTVP
jgi:hypothetical protein